MVRERGSNVLCRRVLYRIERFSISSSYSVEVSNRHLMGIM